jgi:hypothetical protein
MQLGGDYPFRKDSMPPLLTHALQFKDMLRTAKALPAGNMPKPLDALALQWFYMLFYKNDHTKFVIARKKLKTKTFETVTKFFEAQFNQNKMACSSAWSLSASKSVLTSSSKANSATRFMHVRTNVVRTEQNASLHHATHDAALMMIAMSNTIT